MTVLIEDQDRPLVWIEESPGHVFLNGKCCCGAASPEPVDVDQLGFHDLLAIGTALLEHYPPDTIVCSHSKKADIGAQAAAAIADLIESCAARLSGDPSEEVPFNETPRHDSDSPSDGASLLQSDRRTSGASFRAPPEPVDGLIVEARAKVKTAIGLAKSARPANEWVIGTLEQVRERLDSLSGDPSEERGGSDAT